MKAPKSYYLFGMLIILAAHTIILVKMLNSEKKVKASEENKIQYDFHDKNKIKIYPTNDKYIDSLLNKHQVFSKEFVLR